jgi:hypothetical protein
MKERRGVTISMALLFVVLDFLLWNLVAKPIVYYCFPLLFKGALNISDNAFFS